MVKWWVLFCQGLLKLASYNAEIARGGQAAVPAGVHPSYRWNGFYGQESIFDLFEDMDLPQEAIDYLDRRAAYYAYYDPADYSEGSSYSSQSRSSNPRYGSDILFGGYGDSDETGSQMPDAKEKPSSTSPTPISNNERTKADMQSSLPRYMSDNSPKIGSPNYAVEASKKSPSGGSPEFASNFGAEFGRGKRRGHESEEQEKPSKRLKFAKDYEVPNSCPAEPVDNQQRTGPKQPVQLPGLGIAIPHQIQPHLFTPNMPIIFATPELPVLPILGASGPGGGSLSNDGIEDSGLKKNGNVKNYGRDWKLPPVRSQSEFISPTTMKRKLPREFDSELNPPPKFPRESPANRTTRPAEVPPAPAGSTAVSPPPASERNIIPESTLLSSFVPQTAMASPVLVPSFDFTAVNTPASGTATPASSSVAPGSYNPPTGSSWLKTPSSKALLAEAMSDMQHNQTFDNPTKLALDALNSTPLSAPGQGNQDPNIPNIPTPELLAPAVVTSVPLAED
jgi:hypothetical protein